MNKKHRFIPLIVIVVLAMACSFGYEGVNFGSDPDVEKIEDLTATAEGAQLLQPMPEISTPEPTAPPSAPQNPPAPTPPQNSEPQTNTSGPKEYSVSATNFDCICQVSGNQTVEFIFKDNHLEVPNAAGGTDVYEKIGENQYKRTWMGYYILVSGEGDQKTETRVDEERSAVIIINDNGYVMEHYQGSSSSPCCFHTFTNVK